MIRLVREFTAVLVAIALLVGTLSPAIFAHSSATPAAAAVMDHAPPCHGSVPTKKNSGDKGTLCPFAALCAAKCFQAIPSAPASVTAPLTVAAARLDFADEHADGRSPSPPLKIPRA